MNAFMPIIGSDPPLADACILAVLEVSSESESESGEQMRTPIWLGKAQVSFVVVFRKTRSSLLLSTPAKSGRPSPLKSAAATACAPEPLGTSK